MNNKFFSYCGALMLMAAAFTTSCSSDDFVDEQPTQPAEQRVAHHATMTLDGGLTGYEQTRATSDWANGAKIYLQFTVGGSHVDGVATYSSSAQTWDVQYYGSLNAGENLKCEAYYFENAGETTYSEVKMTANTAVYADKNATYTLEDNKLTVIATLKPLLGRMRLKGTAGQNYAMHGFNHYTAYSITDNSFSSAAVKANATVPSGGYTNYYYGFFPNASNKELTFDDLANRVSFVRTMGSNALEAGRSGYLDIPTMSNRNGWTVKEYSPEIAVKRGLIGYYTFDASTADDEMGNYPGFMTGGTFITDTPNGAGMALFLKEKEFVTIGSAPLTTLNACTVNLWVKDFGVGYMLRTFDSGNGHTRPSLMLNSDAQFCARTTDNRWSNNTITFAPYFSTYQADQWVMVTLVYNSISNVSLFINGVKVDTGNGSDYGSGGSSMQIGGGWDSNNRAKGTSHWTVPMKIDNVRMHNIALTDDEVMEVYQAEKNQ